MAKLTIADIQQMKTDGRKAVMWVAYSYEMAAIIEMAEPDMFLVGDSGSQFLLGHPDMNDTTVDEMIVMGRAVRRATERVPVIVDLPFMSYHTGIEDAIRNAGRIMKETRCSGVKLEGGAHFAPTIEALVKAGIPVMAHMGVTPMTSVAIGGMTGGATLPEEQIWNDARSLVAAGAFSLVLTGIRPPLTEEITKEVRIPTIAGYLAGDECDILLGFPGTIGYAQAQVGKPTSAYGQVGKAIYDAASEYITDARAGQRRAPGAS
ncbi:MAG: 3-methyl-2-oxobutanoate hydroxymethyltransferase [Chloroflexota bacterium]|nr:3-methyl-2-oxobutanoate hydroxymethyltransferase [Chloroflexota bacterium]MDE2883648.1 3-methyl-2-oxobutanoate hydroxymethyltransferase [Chloroflexota bacterium]